MSRDETDEEAIRRDMSRLSKEVLKCEPPQGHLMNRLVLISFKSQVLYRGKVQPSPVQEMTIKSWMPREGVILDDGSFVSFSNIASISPRAI